jgi:FAD/FMN-containing dehydrogenase
MPNTARTGASTVDIPRLRAAVTGRVIVPGDEEYDRVRAIHAGGVDRHPAAVVRVADADDVAYVVSLARETGVDLAVRSGGHSHFGVCDDGIVIDLSALRSLEIDPAGRTAWAGTGLTAGQYTAEAGRYGLATGFGDTGSVGIGGITLGGGVGYLARKHGLTIDDLLAAEVVTADGQLRRVDADNHPDLFWAIRGGGGNFGVATRFHLRLHEVGTVLGGILVLPATPEVVAGFVAASAAAPDGLSTIANVMAAPPLPFLPAEHHGKLVVMAMMAYIGDVADGERAVAPLRALAEPLADLVRPVPYPELFPPEDEDYRPMAVGRTLFTDAVDVDTAAMIIERLRASTASMAVAQLRVLGGALARVPADATAFAHRQQPIMAYVAAVYTDPAEVDTHESWVTALADELRPGEDAAYVNFLGDDSRQRIRAAYPGRTWDRLVEVKRRYDPGNVFRVNNNIDPGPVS